MNMKRLLSLEEKIRTNIKEFLVLKKVQDNINLIFKDNLGKLKDLKRKGSKIILSKI